MHLFHHDDSAAKANAMMYLEKQKKEEKAAGEHYHFNTIKNGKVVTVKIDI